ncbi:DEAD/DEAH box helicase family protein [Paenibacillus apii]|uniref:DEAD/DEAH box helicase family protein n=1 Tax=Paenibacillus apii TaxID=1850370 RepID=UPI00143C911B|nr:DEAD/DEAH box helicase family protein [Paenibacillus apii]NJJ37835.1 DEAD/DEAH box helicase family protein [Paenibacillus apii]
MSNKPFNVAADLVALLDMYWDEPAAFGEDMLGFDPDEWQRQAMADIARHPRVTIRSGQGVGKTAFEAVIVVWFLCTRPYPKVICTAPTKQQLHDVLWAEVAKWLERSMVKNLLKWTKTKVYMIGHEQRWFATARTATKPENMQGFHEEHMLFIVDEASGVKDEIMEAIFGTLSGDGNKLVLCGNPTRTSGVFYDSHHKDRADYRAHKVSSRQTRRTNKKNIEMLERKYGKNSDVVRVRVDGEFPRMEPDTFIPLELAEAAAMRTIYQVVDDNERDEDLPPAWRTVIPDAAELEIGVDVARFGDDETDIVPRIGILVPFIRSYTKQDTMVTAGWVLATAKECMQQYARPHCTIKIDDDGVGGGVTDRVREVVREEGLNITVVDCHNGGKALDPEHYDNWGTEAWATVRDLLQAGDIQFPNDEDLIGQLSSRKYTVTSKGRIVLETKKEMKKRGLRSPDRADALVLAFAKTGTVIDPAAASLLGGGRIYG